MTASAVSIPFKAARAVKVFSTEPSESSLRARLAGRGGVTGALASGVLVPDMVASSSS